MAAHGKPIIQYCLYKGFIRRYESIEAMKKVFGIFNNKVKEIIDSKETYNDHFLLLRKMEIFSQEMIFL